MQKANEDAASGAQEAVLAARTRDKDLSLRTYQEGSEVTARQVFARAFLGLCWHPWIGSRIISYRVRIWRLTNRSLSTMASLVIQLVRNPRQSGLRTTYYLSSPTVGWVTGSAMKPRGSMGVSPLLAGGASADKHKPAPSFLLMSRPIRRS